MRRPSPFLAALLLLAAPSSARAFPMPDLVLEVGRTFGIETQTKGVYDQGGFSTTLSALWPVADRMRLGGAFYADDVGSQTTELMDDTQSPPVPLGTFEVAHLAIYGGSWRLEVVGPRLKRFETFARGDWGLYWLRADQTGTLLEKSRKVGWGLGAGIMLPVLKGQAVGLTFGMDRIFVDTTRDYMTAALAWHWRPGSRRDEAPRGR